MTRRGVGGVALAVAGAALLPLRATAAATSLDEVASLGAQAKALREAARARGARAAGELGRGFETTLSPLQSKMLAIAPDGSAARTQAQLMQGHLLELKDALAKAEFSEYVSKRTKQAYPGGKVERELEEVSDTFDDFMRLMGVPPASAATPPAAAEWAGRYSDPNHPRGWRELSLDGTALTIVGRDEPNGPKWTLRATTAGASATIDFSPKGGPKDLAATLSPDGRFIRFPDNNAWTKLSPWSGRYADPNHPAGYRDVTVSGSTLTIVGRDEPKAAEWTLSATVDGPSALIGARATACCAPRASLSSALGGARSEIDTHPFAFAAPRAARRRLQSEGGAQGPARSARVEQDCFPRWQCVDEV